MDLAEEEVGDDGEDPEEDVVGDGVPALGALGGGGGVGGRRHVGKKRYQMSAWLENGWPLDGN